MRSVYRYITGLVLLWLFVVLVPGAAQAFNDTSQHWARLEIEHLQSREIISGYPDGSYRPQAYISRQEFVVLLIRTLNKQKEAEVLYKGDPSFSDTATWARGYVELASELGIARGDGQGTFSPLRTVSREEAITMLVNCLGKEMVADQAIGFIDKEQISPWARPAISYAGSHGLVHGFPDNTLQPHSNITRAEVAILLESLLAAQGRQYQMYGTITRIDFPLHKASVNIAGREESFEFASNLAVWNQETRQPQSEINLPSTAYLDLNSNGKLAYILITGQKANNPVRFSFSSLPDNNYGSQPDNKLVSLAENSGDEESLAVDAEKAAASLQVTSKAMGVGEFTARTGATGKGQLVAIIDSGIDPGHPDLQSTSEGYKKMLDFVDLTNEGEVALTSIKASAGNIKLGDNLVKVDTLGEEDGLYKYGYLNLDFLPENTGLSRLKVLVVLLASKSPDEYDTAYFDIDGDGQVNDEAGIKKYSSAQQVVSIRGEKTGSFNFVLSDILDLGKRIKLGFDGFGHGTEVAGIVAAQGKVQGMAPDSQLLVIKIMDQTGNASLGKLESALSLAADRGAGVAVVSLGQYKMSAQEVEALAKTVALVRKSTGMIICMAAGNSGPGLSTVADSTSIHNIITVGAYATPEMWERDYGCFINNPTLWYFSSVGPALNAAASPLLLAPGSAVSTYPLWTGYNYRKVEGTSMAAPHLAGAAALLLDACKHRLYNKDPDLVYQALLAGAQPVNGLQVVEQGFGAVNLPGAWEELQLYSGKTAIAQARQYNPGNKMAEGLYIRGLNPGSLSLHIVNPGENNVHLTFGSFASWIKPQQQNVQIPANSERIVGIDYENMSEPGLYSSILAADDSSSSGVDLATLQTVVVPYEFGAASALEAAGTMGPGAQKHYFFRVPDGVSQVSFKLIIKNGQGRARINVISPGGIMETSSYAGIGKDENVTSSTLAYSNPDPGIWEVVVYSTVFLSDYNLKDSQYSLQATIDGELRNSRSVPDDRYLVTTVVPTFTPGAQVNVSLFFWNRASKMPASGLVSINGRLYEINHGVVTLPYITQGDSIALNVAW